MELNTRERAWVLKALKVLCEDIKSAAAGHATEDEKRSLAELDALQVKFERAR